MLTTDPHGRAQLNCSSCHTVHGNNAKALVKDDKDNFCGILSHQCRGAIQESVGASAGDDNIRCSSCHFPDDTQRSDAGARHRLDLSELPFANTPARMRSSIRSPRPICSTVAAAPNATTRMVRRTIVCWHNRVTASAFSVTAFRRRIALRIPAWR